MNAEEMFEFTIKQREEAFSNLVDDIMAACTDEAEMGMTQCLYKRNRQVDLFLERLTNFLESDEQKYTVSTTAASLHISWNQE